MADEIDLANDLIDNEIRRVLKNRELRQKAAAPIKVSEFCIECEEVIPFERRELGFRRCVSCAQEAERRGQMFADD